jgi:hypothetical protein
MKTYTGETALLEYLQERADRPSLWVELHPVSGNFSNYKRTEEVHTCYVESSEGKVKFTGISEAFYDSTVTDFDTRTKRANAEDEKEEAEGEFRTWESGEFEESDYNIPAFITEANGWIDNSWHNDTCPHFEHEGKKLALWIGDKEKLDCSHLYSIDPIAEDGMCYGEYVLETDSVEELKNFIDQYKP